MTTSILMQITNMSFRCRVRAAIRCAAVTLLVATGSHPASSQAAPGAGPQRASRIELATLTAKLEQQTQGGKLGEAARKRAMSELAAVRERLETGDFRVGDRFVITIRQDSIRSDTIAVRDSLKVTVGNLADISLAGVLRSELEERMGAHVARYLRNVSVRTLVLTRVAIFGAVRNPGFYYAVPDRPVSDLVMVAGGPAPEANLNEFELARGQAKLIGAKDSRRALKEGTTLEQLDIRSGDEVTIPAKHKLNWQLVTSTIVIISTLTFTIFQFLLQYYARKNNQ